VSFEFEATEREVWVADWYCDDWGSYPVQPADAGGRQVRVLELSRPGGRCQPA
jgi:hypothetical protein